LASGDGVDALLEDEAPEEGVEDEEGAELEAGGVDGVVVDDELLLAGGVLLLGELAGLFFPSSRPQAVNANAAATAISSALFIHVL
jgi:hypothetical protein